MTTPVSNAQLNASSSTNPQRGIASIRWGDHVLRFRTNPNEITWTYSLITHIEQTYGGRVVQILGTKVDDLTVKIDVGYGGWPYLMKVTTFMRDLMIAQRNDQPATFEYTTRNWKLKVYAVNIPFADQVTATNREITLNFKVQEDVTGVISASSISSALQSYITGINWRRDEYNTANYSAPISDSGMIPNITEFAGGALDLVGRLRGVQNLYGVDLVPSITTGPSGSGIGGFTTNGIFGQTFGGTARTPGSGFVFTIPGL